MGKYFFAAILATIMSSMMAGRANAAPKTVDLNDPATKSMMEKIPEVSHKGSWPLDYGYVDYETLHRSGDFLFGKWAANLADACAHRNGYTSMPSEKHWITPIQGFACPGSKDNGEILFAVIGNGAKSGAMHDVKLEPSVGGGCNAFQRNVNAHNTNTGKDVRATVSYHNSNGAVLSKVVYLHAGQIATDILFCDYGDAWVSGAVYPN